MVDYNTIKLFKSNDASDADTHVFKCVLLKNVGTTTKTPW